MTPSAARRPKESPKRDSALDALKGLAICLVVLSHVLGYAYNFAPSLLSRVVSAFNMPLFMALSGYLLFGREGNRAAQFVWRKFLRLMVPYLAWLIVYTAVFVRPVSAWASNIACGIVTPLSPDPGRLWFLWMLFAFYVAFTIVRRFSTKDIALVISAVIAVFALKLHVTYNMKGYADEWLYPFFIGGYLLCKHQQRLTALLKPAMAFVWGTAFVVFFAIGSTQPGEGIIPLVATGTSLLNAARAAAIALNMALIYVAPSAAVLALYIAYRHAPPWFTRPQAWLGLLTIGIYATNTLFVPFIRLGTGAGVVATWSVVMILSVGATLLITGVPALAVVFLGTPIRAPAVRPAGANPETHGETV